MIFKAKLKKEGWKQSRGHAKPWTGQPPGGRDFRLSAADKKLNEEEANDTPDKKNSLCN
jgi:hypothetical protein